MLDLKNAKCLARGVAIAGTAFADRRKGSLFFRHTGSRSWPVSAAIIAATPSVMWRGISHLKYPSLGYSETALTDSPSVFSRARGAAAALPSGPGRWRAAPPFFLFRFFAAGFSYGVDRDERPIARTRVYNRVNHFAAVSRARARRSGAGAATGSRLIDGAIARTRSGPALSISSPFLVRARGRPAASGFDPGGAGAS